MAPPAPLAPTTLRQTEQQSRLTCGVLTDGSNVQTHPNFYRLMKKVDFVLSDFEWFQSVASFPHLEQQNYDVNTKLSF